MHDVVRKIKQYKIFLLLFITIFSFTMSGIGYSKNYDGSSEIEIKRISVIQTITGKIEMKKSKNEQYIPVNSRVHQIKNRKNQDACNELCKYLDSVLYEGEDDFSIYIQIADYVYECYGYDADKKNNTITKMYESGKGSNEAITEMIRAMCEMCNIPVTRIQGESGAWNKVYLENKWYYSDITCMMKENDIKYMLSGRLWEDEYHKMK